MMEDLSGGLCKMTTISTEYFDYQCIHHELKKGFAVVYSATTSEKVTVRFIRKCKVTLIITRFHLYDSEEAVSRKSESLTVAMIESPIEFTFTIPVGDSTKYYDANFLITGENDLSINLLLPIVVIPVDRDLENLAPTEPYKALKLPKLVHTPCNIVNVPAAKRYSRPKSHFNNLAIELKRYKTDSRLHDLRKERLLQNCPVLNRVLIPTNYVEKFKLLIDLCAIEENAAGNRMLNSHYKISLVKEGQETDTFLFEIYTDDLYLNSYIYVQEIEGMSTSSTCYQGLVTKFDDDCATLEFPKQFLQMYNPDKEFYLRYETWNYNAALMHRALDMMDHEHIMDVIFPKKFYNCEDSLKLNLFNKEMEHNKEQKRAVQEILSKRAHRSPYIVFGPPGTGKTTTILEAIKQVYTMKKDSTILVCTPFNKHVDEITMKLMDFIPKADHKDTLHRLYASGYLPEDIPKKIKCVTNLKTDQEELKNVKNFKRYRIILSTLITAGRFTCPAYKGHFSHIFVDEAGFASEPEVLVPLVGQMNEHTQLILAGDPKQLDPVVKSEHARTFGYDVTMIERLMNYSNGYREAMVVKLLKNYRSHPAIISVPNDLFYNSELEACANKDKYSRFCSWPHLLKKDFPVMFHSVVSQEEREASDPSFFNLKEIQIVYGYVDKLLKTPGVSESDIGIITTYKKQASKITRYLEKKSIKNVTVGSVEIFLSSEKEIIIISTVRSSVIEETEETSVGFLKNPRRFNVALTRAKALEIVVGNAGALKQVECWNSFINYCKKNDSYIEEKTAKGKKNKHSKK